MNLYPLTVLSFVFITAAAPAFAQSTADNSVVEKKEINIGSHVLKQEGESGDSYKNESYTYNKIWEVANTPKNVLYDRTFKWLQNITGATVSDVVDEPGDKNSIGATLSLQIPERSGMKDQTVSFRFKFSFKENKVRLQADGFNYYGRWDNGYQTRQVAVPYGITSERYYDAGEYKKEFHDLRPMLKKTMRGIYDDFDERYLKIVRSMKASVLQNADNNW